LDKNGKFLSNESLLEKNQWRGDIQSKVKQEIEEGQGCRLTGFLKVYRVPGNIHVATHAHMDIVNYLKIREGVKFDFSYEIHHLSFGNKEDFDYISQHFEDLEMEHPADGIKGVAKMEEVGNKTVPMDFKSMFYLVAVPSYFEKGLFKYHVYQLIANYETTYDEEHVQGNSILMFNFEFSPITENITQN